MDYCEVCRQNQHKDNDHNNSSLEKAMAQDFACQSWQDRAKCQQQRTQAEHRKKASPDESEWVVPSRKKNQPQSNGNRNQRQDKLPAVVMHSPFLQPYDIKYVSKLVSFYYL
jgi:hypothetical protein